MTTHVSATMLTRYASGEDLPSETLWVLEAHLDSCPACREQVGQVTTDPRVTELVQSVRTALEPRLGPGHGRWWGLRHRFRRQMARWAAPAAMPWLLCVLAIPLAAMLLDLNASTDQTPLLLLVAPIVPALGVAASWNRFTDRAHALVSVTAQAGLGLVLRRTLAALIVILPPLTLAGLLVGASPALWLLPGLAMTTAALTLGAVIGVGRATAALAGLWTLAVILPVLARGSTPVPLEPAAAPFWAALALVSAAALTRLRDGYQQDPRHF
ncbi:hypothetical protein Kisp01_27830 [Kineosporia sp. NBRC 101677]|uniref:zf-HC2 domain-containing protein n=1 Tax=Kineosporia sp. NBRC 101677 TaxID=3032197 RepID=UPI0024A46DE0|nr:zf-HC2 domain-containing protein [Kineosporia sp. NBRC 101677]GLY15768.1 hypothetical protein Kisp01_27830 [Kineosporia sp. NBRC 101677]